MPRRVLQRAFPLVLAALVGAFIATTASGQIRFAPEVRAAAAVDEVLRRGFELEAARRWGEALAHYEDALRNYPGEIRLERQFSLARMHYDLVRRYSDASYRESLATLSERDALGLYAEVLLKIQSHFVDQPDWKELVDRGTSSVEIALADETFARTNLKNVSADSIDRLQMHLRQSLGGAVVRDRHGARAAVEQAVAVARESVGLPAVAVVMEYTSAAAGSLDDYSAYLTADQLREVYSQIDGNFVGLGVELKASDGALLIVKVIPGGPAHRGGVRAGDRIVAVDGVSTVELSTDEAADLLQGPEGSFVEMDTAPLGGAARRLRLRREHVDVPSVDDVKLVDADLGVGYLKLTCFQKNTTREIDTALWQLHRQGMRSLIIDLRGNPGGLLTTSVEVADKFIERGTIVSTRGRNPNEDYTYAAHRNGTWRVPLVVLIDGESASASEILAGAIRETRRGTVVGSTSYGKGSVQGIFPLNYAHAGIRLTTAKFYSPQGNAYNKRGVSPDVTVQQVARPLDGAPSAELLDAESADAALEAAVQVARRQLARR